ncbi:MAG: hypothetical protein P4M09_17930 [Devosia sp.]|nr:hypothetical protein [Devosia sp.]
MTQAGHTASCQFARAVGDDVHPRRALKRTPIQQRGEGFFPEWLRIKAPHIPSKGKQSDEVMREAGTE